MSRRYPTVRITPTEVVEYFQARCQQPSIEDAERWLSSHKRCIEEMMNLVIKNGLERILEEATLMAYPDPAFDKQFRQIDDAIQAASDEYAHKMGLEQYSSSYEERDMLEVVARVLVRQSKFTACIAYSQEFTRPSNGSKDKGVAHRSKRIHLSSEGGKITAEVVTRDVCKHLSDVFVPERRGPVAV